MALIQVIHDPTDRQLAVFGVLWLLFVGAGGAAAAWRHDAWLAAGLLWAAAIAVPAGGFAFRPVLRWTYIGLSYATWPIGLVISQVLLIVLYFLVLTPAGVLMRLLGRDPMCRGFDREAESYWVDRADASERPDPERYFRQS